MNKDFVKTILIAIGIDILLVSIIAFLGIFETVGTVGFIIVGSLTGLIASIIYEKFYY